MSSPNLGHRIITLVNDVTVPRDADGGKGIWMVIQLEENGELFMVFAPGAHKCPTGRTAL